MSSLDAAAIKGQAYPNLAVVILLAIGTLLMVITSISAPILSSVKMFRLTSNVNGIRRYVDVGLWGYCVVPATPGGGCSKPIVGFVLNSAVANVLISTLLCLISLMLQISVVAVANARVYAISDSSNESLQFSWGGTHAITPGQDRSPS
ncbi:uncharacterized protein LACBIDRAFT_321664 [Laccaria bicolor S238N-H82]|uniref:Predicted protein n=1 Tax=Laccaria bicolor (strain S238N-H82 / ATCC MYA-4686) TaxID=486041 RepID=B0CTR0_LACBS|nr:uncharacterized protein LACBIDRAFT_321664 [Laccaria bicolor S238N-H82]EDR13961.1 predicted protein [Laccaria bicolor S238N-H82]|eukprot:XP_001874520.1 predicted protein [Laccaria bicolor S238N-H82]